MSEMPKQQVKRNTAGARDMTKAQALVILRSAEGRALHEKSLRKWDKKFKPLRDSIRASQSLGREDLEIRINTRD